MGPLAHWIRRHWHPADALMLATSGLALLLFVANATWQRVPVAYGGVLVGLLPQVVGALRTRGALCDSVTFGGGLAALWILGDGATIHTVGAWGAYLVPGPRLWETPPLVLLVGWLSATYLHYTTRRVMDWSGRAMLAGLVAALAALVLGIVGESLFVEAGLWTYADASWTWWRVPAFVPVAYALSFALLPLLFRLQVLMRAVVFAVLLFGVSVGLGLAVGFFPR